MNEAGLRESICEVGRLLYNRGLIAGSDGNISARLGANRFLVTPSGARKGEMQPDDLIIADDTGEGVSGTGRVSSEFFTHLSAYAQRPDMDAVVHAHPPWAVALTVAGISLADPVLPEVLYALSAVPTAPYATPGSREGASAIEGLLSASDAVLLDRHGVIAAGASPLEAFHTVEQVEHAAKIVAIARSIGPVAPLTEGEFRRLIENKSKLTENS